MPPRRKKQSAEPAQSQETKEFTDARNKILSITPESLALFQNAPNHSLEHLSDDPYAIDVLHLVNAVDFFNEIIPLISTCPFHSQEEIAQFVDGVRSLYELGNSIKKENMTSINYVNEFKPIWDSIRNFAVHININLFHEMFSTSRSTISSVLRHIVQMAHEDPRSNPIIFERFKSVASTRKRLATRLSVLMHGRKIRTVITLWDKLIETQSEVIQFFKATGLMTAEMMSTVNNCFKLMFDSALHLKNLLVIQQLAAIIDRCLAHPLKCPIPPISDDEEDIVVDPQPTSENEIGRAITDELVLEVHETTDFLRVYKNFIDEVKPTIDKGEFLTKFTTFLEKSQSFEKFDLCPTLFTIFYKFRKLEITSLPIMVAAENDPNAKDIKSLYRNLQILIHNMRALSGEEIDAESSLELLYPIIEKIRQDCSEVKETAFQGQISNILSSLDSICKDLQTIDDTICVSFQGDQMIRKIEKNFPDIKLNPFNFHCLFYLSPPVLDNYEPDRTKTENGNNSKNFQPIIDTFVDTLKKFGIEIEIEKNIENGHLKISVPDIFEYFMVLLENYGYRQIQVLLASPPKESDFFWSIFELQKEMLLNDVKDEKLDNAITVISSVYYFLLLLDYAGYIDFSNSIHLTYLKSYSRINFGDDKISSMIEDLNSPFYCTSIENYDEVVNYLLLNSEQSVIDSKLNHMRQNVYSCIDTVCHLQPKILHKHFDDLIKLVGKFTYIITELTDTISSDEFYDLLCRLKEANISEIGQFIDYCIALHNELKKCWRIIPIQTNLLSYLHADIPAFSFKKAIIFDLLDFLKYNMRFGLIYCDVGYFESIISEPVWPKNMYSICKEFLKTIVISHDILFKMLTVAASGLSNCSKINETVDLINRGMLTCNSVKTLLFDLLNIRALSLAPPEKIEFMAKYAHQLTAFLMLFNTIEILFPHMGVAVARMLNLRNFLLSYCNSIIFLTNSLDAEPDISSSIFQICSNLKKLVSTISLNSEINSDKLKEIYNLYYELRLKFSKVSPKSILQNASGLIEKVEDSELQEKFELVLESLNSPVVAECQANIDSLSEVMQKKLNNSTKGELYELCMKIYDIFSILIVYYSRIRDEEAFFIFASTNYFTINLQSPPILSPISPVTTISPFLPHQHIFNTTNKQFKKFVRSMLNDKVKIAFDEDKSSSPLFPDLDGFLFPPPFVLPIDAQQNLLDFFVKEKEKHEQNTKNKFIIDEDEDEEINKQGENEGEKDASLSDSDLVSKKIEAEILRNEIFKLESESEKLLKTIDVLNQTTKNLYDEFVSSQADQFSQFDQIQAQALSDFRINMKREQEMNSMMQSASIEMKKKSDYLNQLNKKNESLKRSNEYIEEEIRRRKEMKIQFDSGKNFEQKKSMTPILNRLKSSPISTESSSIIGDSNLGDNDNSSLSSSSSSSIAASSSSAASNLSSISGISEISKVDDLLLSGQNQSSSVIFNEEGFIPEAFASFVNPMCCALRKEDSDMIKWTVKKWEEMEIERKKLRDYKREGKLNEDDDEEEDEEELIEN